MSSRDAADLAKVFSRLEAHLNTRLQPPASQHSISSAMRFLRSLLPSLLLVGATVVGAASSWTFEDATVSVGGSKDKYVEFRALCSSRSFANTIVLDFLT